MPNTRESGLGLRELKRARMLDHLQHVALGLFDELGYEAVTVERIAEVAEVSPSTIYRHFRSKDRILIYLEANDRIRERVVAHCLESAPVEAARRGFASLAEVIDATDPQLMRRFKYILNETSVYRAFIAEMIVTARVMGEEMAIQAGLPNDNIETQVVAINLIWGLVTALDIWNSPSNKESFQDLLERTYLTMESGLRIPTT